MDSGRQRARKALAKIASLKERQDVALETWRHMAEAMKAQADAVVDEVRAALKIPPSPDVWVELDAPNSELKQLAVFVGKKETDGKANTEEAAIARFYLDLPTCHVFSKRKPSGVAEEDAREKSNFEPEDLGDLEYVTLAGFVEELVDFLKWALVGEGSGGHEFRFRSR